MCGTVMPTSALVHKHAVLGATNVYVATDAIMERHTTPTPTAAGTYTC